MNRSSLRALLLTAAVALVVIPAASALAVVTTVNCTGVPVNDGNNLIAAYNGTPGSSTNPSVVKLDPCVYDLGIQTLNLKTFVDLQGHGRNVTIITSAISRVLNPGSGTLTVPSTADVEISDVTVRNTATDQGFGIRNTSDTFVLDDVIVEASSEEDAIALSSTGSLRGIDLLVRASAGGEKVISSRAVAFDDTGNSVVSTSFFITSGIAQNNVGIRIEDSATTLDDVSVLVSGGTNLFGIRVLESGEALIRDIVVDVIGGTASRGLDVENLSSAIARDGRIRAIEASSLALAIRIAESSGVQLEDVTAIGFNSASTAGEGVRALSSRLQADRSTFSGVTSVNLDNASTANIGVSKLIGPRSAAGTFTCVGAYNGLYAALNNVCL